MPAAFPNRIAAVRRSRGLTQRALSEFPDCPAPATILRLERGHRLPRLSTLVSIAAALEVDVADLLETAAATATPETENGAQASAALKTYGGRDVPRLLVRTH